jgi:uncharacterized membrane protein (DUF4010 family)
MANAGASAQLLGEVAGSVTGVAVALGAGLLIGLERERRKGRGADRQAAGLRTFTVAALAGALAQHVSAAMAVVLLAGVALLAGLAYWRSRSSDPGLTTEVALLTTVLIGILAMVQPALAAGAAVVLAALLAARERLHRFATEWLTQDELHDALLLSALALVWLPLLSAQPLAWLGHMSPRQILQLVVVILLMQAAGHVARRLLGVRAGLALSGLLGGFVSSTATISAMGGMAREGRVAKRVAAAAAVLSMVATWVQVLVMATVVSPALVASLWRFVAVGAVLPVAMGAVLWWGAPAVVAAPVAMQIGRALRIREAMMVTGLLVAGAIVVNLALQQGTLGLLGGTALAAVADAHAPMASLMAMAADGHLPGVLLQQALLVALLANGVTRGVVAWVSGGPGFAGWVGAALALNLACVGGWLLGWGG